MQRAAVMFRNLADQGVVSASTAESAMPAVRLQDPHIGRKWRGRLGEAEYVLLDLQVPQLIDTIAMMGLSLDAAGSSRIRISLLDPSAQDGAVLDTGVVSGAVDPDYGYLIRLLPALVSARFVRIDLLQPGAAFISAGRLAAGARDQFAYNFSYGWTWGRKDRSRRSQSRGGQTFVSPDNSYRFGEMNFEWVTREQRFGFVEQMDMVNGQHDDILFLTDPESSNLGRDSIWGLVSELTPIVQPYFDMYSKTYRIEERL